MDITALSSSATVALATTIAFLLIARSWAAISRIIDARPYFAASFLKESAQRYRDDFARLSAAQSIYLGGALVFAMLFVAAHVLEAERLFEGYPAWQIYVQLAFLGLTTLFAAYKVATTIIARRETRFQRDACLAIGHQLNQMSSGVVHVYHDVPTSAGIIDHVVVCSLGVFGVNVFARRARPGQSACIRNNRLRFSGEDESISVAHAMARNRRLGKRLRQVTRQPVNVRSVIALPGWEIQEQADESHLLVNERSASMLLGWKDTASFLMDDDVATIRQLLAKMS